MKILVVTQYFYPENFIINELCAELADRGHEITVATGKPNYPGGKIHEDYANSGVIHDTFNSNVKVIRVPIRPRKNSNSFDLALNYISFAISSIYRFPKLLRNQEFDIIFVFCVSPITVALPAIKLRKSTGAKVGLWVQDLWPDSIAAAGYPKSGILMALGRQLSSWIYKKSDFILVQSEGFIQPIKKLAPDCQISVLQNFAPRNTGPTQSELSEKVVRAFDGHFCILFAGNIGKAQSVKTIIETAERLKHEKHIRIFIAGDGSMKNSLQNTIQDRNINNIEILGSIEPELMPQLYQLADALLVTLRKDPALELTVPSKLQAYMMAGKPIVGAVSGECADQIRQSEAGVTVDSENSEGLADCILQMSKKSLEEREQLGKNALAFYEANFEINQVVDRLIEHMSHQLEGIDVGKD